MKRYVLPLVAALCISLTVPGSLGADAKAQFQELVQKVQAKMKEGKTSEADLAEELKQFDALLAEHKDEKTEDVANILFMKGLLYAQVIDDEEQATKLLQQVKADFPDTEVAKKVDGALANFAAQSEARKIQRTLVKGAQFPDFEAKDLNGEPLSIGKFKGKVVLVDFWATWCGPCIQELPTVKAAYDKYHKDGFEIIGISLDNDRDKLTSFIKEKDMPWPQYFDGKGWDSELADKYGVNSIPATYLLDREGKIIAKGLRGEALGKAVGEAIQ